MKIKCTSSIINCNNKPIYFTKSKFGIFSICDIHFYNLFSYEVFITESEYKLLLIVTNEN